MNRRLVTLGTSHGDPTYSRFNSSTLLQVNGKSYLIDAGAPVNALMIRQKYRIQELRAVFITHMHDDHVGGLPGLIKSLAKYPAADQHTDFFLPSQKAIDGLLAWVSVQHRSWKEGLMDFKVIAPEMIFADENIRVTALRTHHLTDEENPEPTYGYKVDFADGFRLFYTGDLRNDFSDFPQIITEEASDICICESTHIDLNRDIKVLQKCPIKKIIFNHVASFYHGEKEQNLINLGNTLYYPAFVAHDGDVFEF